MKVIAFFRSLLSWIVIGFQYKMISTKPKVIAMAKGKHTSNQSWEQFTIEFLLSKQKNKSLTLKKFCDMRKFTYNTARIRMKKWLKRIEEAGGVDRYESEDVAILADDDEEAVEEATGHLESLNNPLKSPIEAKRKNQNAAKGGIYSKYFSEDLIAKAAEGTLDDDLILYRAKALNAMDFLESLQDKINEAILQHNTETLERLEQQKASTNKSLDWCLRRIESLATTMKKIELTTVMVTKERANVIKTRAQTRMTVQQTKKYRSEQALAKARAELLDKGNKGTTIGDIVKGIQKRRDSLPSFTKHKDKEQNND